MISAELRKLDLGCGASKRPGFEGADGLAFPGVDHVFDFDNFPYPLPDDAFNEVWLDQVLEHLEQPVRVMEELHRISCHNATVHIGVPYFRGPYAWIDPTHRRAFSVHFPRYFVEGDDLCARYGYSKARFEIIRIEFDREWRRSRSLLHWLLIRFAQRWPGYYEQHLSHLLPLNSLTFTLRVIKPTHPPAKGGDEC